MRLTTAAAAAADHAWIRSANADLRAIAQLRACRPIPEAQVREICHKARELLIEEGNVTTVMAPVTVCDAPPPPPWLCDARNHG